VRIELWSPVSNALYSASRRTCRTAVYAEFDEAGDEGAVITGVDSGPQLDAARATRRTPR
jgi:hypothetical protein